MAKGMYIGNSSSVARKVKKIYIGQSNVAKKVQKIYIGDSSNKARLCYQFGLNIMYATSYGATNFLYSKDSGATWTYAPSMNTKLNQIRCVNDTMHYFKGDGSSTPNADAYYSTNGGLTWNTTMLPAFDIEYCNGKYYALTNYTGYNKNPYVSTTGRGGFTIDTLRSTKNDYSPLRYVAHDNNLYVITNQVEKWSKLQLDTTSGGTQTASVLTIFTETPLYLTRVNDIYLMMVGTALYKSTNMESWTLTKTFYTGTFFGGGYINGKYVTYTNSSDSSVNGIYYSPDLAGWNKGYVGSSTIRYNNNFIVNAEGQIIIPYTDTNPVSKGYLYSTDGMTWTKKSVPAFTTYLTGSTINIFHTEYKTLL